ncbi:hypothetical protein O3P69_003753 [Scylla paramamosain]|uniref:Uncharacterized protein n=1 Tax=Scylla paramamosain TaxID=85552 RepID=A0AAW0UIP2_SCYPA
MVISFQVGTKPGLRSPRGCLSLSSPQHSQQHTSPRASPRCLADYHSHQDPHPSASQARRQQDGRRSCAPACVGGGSGDGEQSTSWHSLQYRGETVVRRDQLPEEMRQVLENRQMLQPESEKEAQDGAPAADGGEGSSDAAGNLGELSPAILAFLSSSGINEKEVLSVTRHLQHLDARSKCRPLLASVVTPECKYEPSTGDKSEKQEFHPRVRLPEETVEKFCLVPCSLKFHLKILSLQRLGVRENNLRPGDAFFHSAL